MQEAPLQHKGCFQLNPSLGLCSKMLGDFLALPCLQSSAQAEMNIQGLERCPACGVWFPRQWGFFLNNHFPLQPPPPPHHSFKDHQFHLNFHFPTVSLPTTLNPGRGSADPSATGQRLTRTLTRGLFGATHTVGFLS